MAGLEVIDPEVYQTLPEAVWQMYGYRTYEPVVDGFHASRARIKIASSPARTAKSYSAAKDVLPDIIVHGLLYGFSVMDPEKVPEPMRPLCGQVFETFRGWVVCPNYDLAKEFDYFYEDLVERGPGMKWGYEVRRAKKNPQQGDMEIVLFWGKNQNGSDVESVIQVRTSANEKSLQSEELDWTVLSEAAELPEAVWTKYLSTRSTRAILPTTPKVGAGWILDMIEQGKEEPGLGIESFQFTVRANPKYKCDRFWREHQRAELNILNEIKTIPKDEEKPPSVDNGHDCFDPLVGCVAAKDDGFAEQFLGHWTLKEGRVVPLREKEGAQGQPSHVIHVDKPWFRYADLHISMDYGFSDGTCIGFWLVGPNQVVLRRSIYEKGLTPDDIVVRTLDMVRWFENEYGNLECLRRVVGDPKKPEVAELFRRRGLHVWDVDKRAQVDRAAGHLEFMNMLATDPATGEPGLLVHADNHEVIGEWKKLRRNTKTKSETAPTAFIGDDHAYDMARYYVMTRPVGTRKPFLVHSDSHFERTRRKIVHDRKRATVASAYGQHRVAGIA